MQRNSYVKLRSLFMLAKRNNALKQSGESTKFFNSLTVPVVAIPKGYQLRMVKPAPVQSVMDGLEKTMPAGNSIFVKVNGDYKKIYLEDIYLIQALSDYVQIYSHEKRYTMHSTMHGILSKLPEKDFVRMHRSFIVRMSSISKIENDMVFVEDRRIPIGFNYKKELMSRRAAIL